MEHAQLAEIAALLGALGAVGVLVTRGGIFPLIGLGLLGVATGGLGWSLVGDEELRLLFGDPRGLALVAIGAAAAIVLAVPLARYPAVVPVALLAVAPFRVPVQLGAEEAFLLAAALPRDRRVGARTRVPHPARRAPASAAVPPRAAARRVRDLGVDVVPVDVGRALRRHHARVLRLPVRRRARDGRAEPDRRLAAAGTARHPRRARDALRRHRDLAGAHAHALLRTRRRGRERLHVVLPRDVALQGPEPVRPVSRSTDRSPPRRHPRAPWADDRLGRGDRIRRVPVPRALLLLLAVELRRALRRDVRGRTGRRRPPNAHRPPRLRARGDARGSRCRGRRDRGQVGKGRHERTLTPRRGDRRRVQGAPDRGRRRRRPAARELGDRAEGIAEPQRVAHDAADDRSRSSAWWASRSTPGFSPPRRGLSTSSPARTANSASVLRPSSSCCSCTRCSTQASSRTRSRGASSAWRPRCSRASPETIPATEPATDVPPAAPELLAH